MNKPTTAPKPAPPTNGSIESLNHFDKSHPKDDLEIKKHRDESLGRISKKDNKKGMRLPLKSIKRNKIKKFFSAGGSKSNKKDGSPASAQTVEKAPVQQNDAVDASPAIEAITTALTVAPKESPKNTANKEKPNKKKRNDALLIQQLGKSMKCDYLKKKLI